MDATEIIERLCSLQEEVWKQINDGCDSADCFCGKGGFWGSEGYGGTFAEGYRNSGKALEFIEQAVREKLEWRKLQAQHRAAQETRAAPEAPEKTWDCTICGRSNYVTVTHCGHCDFSRMVTREGRLVPRDGQR